MTKILDLLPFSNFLVVQLKQKFVPHIQIKYNLIKAKLSSWSLNCLISISLVPN